MLGWPADMAPPDHPSKLAAVEAAAEVVTIIKAGRTAAAKQAMSQAQAVINAASQVTKPETATESVHFSIRTHRQLRTRVLTVAISLKCQLQLLLCINRYWRRCQQASHCRWSRRQQI